jgi:hypothetical protein
VRRCAEWCTVEVKVSVEVSTKKVKVGVAVRRGEKWGEVGRRGE